MFTRILFFIHRWLGILLSLLFFVWFASGIVMMYHQFPSASREEKAAKLEPLPNDLPSISMLKSRLPEGCRMEGMSVSRYLGQTVFEIRDRQETVRIPADSMQPLPTIDAAYLRSVAALWCAAPVLKTDTLHRLEQWIPFGRLKEEMPIYKFYFADPDGTQLYISSHSGEVLQQTTRAERFWAWTGAIPHWVYFTMLRQDVERWKTTVIWLAAIGCLMVIVGLYAGIYTSVKSHRQRKKWFPYKKKWYYWHHITGLFFGLFALTWAFSGMMSLTDPPEWFLRTHEKIPVRKVMMESAVSPENYPLDYRDVIRAYNGKVTSIEWKQFCDIPFYEIQLSGTETKQCVDASSASVRPLQLTEKDAVQAVRKIHGKDVSFNAQLIDQYDDYYLDRKGRLQLPVWKVSVDNADKTCYYINPSNGQLRDYNTHRRAGFWMYQGLHSLQFRWLVSHPIVWTVVMWLLLLGGTALSVSGVVLGVKYIIRIIRRKNRNMKS